MATFYLTDAEKSYYLRIYLEDQEMYLRMVDIMVYKINTRQIDQPQRDYELAHWQQWVYYFIGSRRIDGLQPGERAKHRSSRAGALRRR